MSDLIGRHLGHFKVTGELGQGGMGEVYRAVDSRLDREVAIKLLPAVFAQDPGRLGRFGREAKVLASLDHPNIGAIYGVEAFDEQQALILQLVEGETLADRIKRAPLSIGDALEVARQIADALRAAHERGVIHRDLKPANVKISEDRLVKVLDFGLAKLAVDDPESKIGQVMASTDSNASTLAAETTTPGMVLGTPGYMSPEQARGLMIDQRTDIWAFGCVLFEMLTGQRPFRGETTADLLAEVIKVEPNWALIPAETPAPVVTLLRRCLEKEVHRRLSSIGDIAITLEETSEITRHSSSIATGIDLSASTVGAGAMSATGRLSRLAAGVLLSVAVVYALFHFFWKPTANGPVALGEVRSIAVLPFKVMGVDEQLPLVADGLEETIRANLRSVAALDRHVGAWTVNRYRDTELDEKAVAAELEVDGLVYGTLRQAADELEATIHLVHGPTASIFWTTNLVESRPLILKNQITMALLNQFQISVDSVEEAKLTEANEVSLAAYASYREGLALLDQFTPSSIEQSTSRFNEAIRLDSQFLPPYLNLASAHWIPTIWGGHTPTPSEGFARVSAVAANARQHFPGEPRLDVLDAQIAMMAEFDWPKAKQFFEKALSAETESPDSFLQWTWYLLFVEARYAAALRAIEQALAVDPERVAYLDAKAEVLSFAGDQSAGLELNESIREQHPNEWDRQLNIAMNLKSLGLSDPSGPWLDRALKEVQAAASASRRNPAVLAGVAEIHAARGEESAIVPLLEELKQQEEGGQFVPSVFLARVAAQRGLASEAIRLLRRGFENREGFSLLYSLRKSDLMGLLAEEPGYWELISEMNFPALPIDHPFYEVEQRMRWRPSGQPVPSSILTVLPFENEATDQQEDDWLGHVIQRDLVRRLNSAGLDGYEVQEVSAAATEGRQIKGRYRLNEGRVQGTAVMVDPSSGSETVLTEWGVGYGALFGALSETALGVADFLQLQPSEAQREKLTAGPTVNPEAFLMFEHGLSTPGRMTVAGDQLARERFQEAMRLDPNYGAPYLSLAEQIWRSAAWGVSTLSFDQAVLQSRSVLSTAAARNGAESTAEAEGWLAMVGQWDWPKAYQHFRSSDGVSERSLGLAWYRLLVEGRYDEALDLIDSEEASARFASQLKARMAWHSGAWDVALAQFAAVPIDQQSWVDQCFWADALARVGQSEQAASRVQRAVEAAAGNPVAQYFEIAIQARSGEQSAAEERLTTLLGARETVVAPALLALVYLSLDEPDQALMALESSFQQASSWHLVGLRAHAYLEALAEEPRYWELVERLQFPRLPIHHEFHAREQAARSTL